MRLLWLLAMLVLSLFACRKNDSRYCLQGGVYLGDEQTAMSDVRLTVYKQVLQNGVFGTSFTTAATDLSSANGLYQLTWERENFAALKLTAEREQFVTREIQLDPNDFVPGEAVLKSIDMYPEAFISVRVQNTGVGATTDRCNFSFVNAIFECACCSNGWREFEGAVIDTTFSCRLYGNRWLKYQRNLNTIEADTVLVDSIWCPAFQITELILQH